MKTSTTHAQPFKKTTTQKKLLVAILLGLAVAGIVATISGWKFAILAGWDSSMAVLIIWTWIIVWPLTPATTRSHAVREDPGRTAADILLISASIASLVAIIFLLLEAGHDSGVAKAMDIGLGLTSIAVSWVLVHTTYTLKYARLYYGRVDGEVDFNEKDAPQYSDFAYLAFTLGMTFQVSDTDLKTKIIRATALKHALLSYLFGTVIIASTINTLVSLSQ
jgi:uncharacterized membrane protein